MQENKPKTGTVNGALWGARARDWAEVQEPQHRPAYELVFTRAGLTAGMRYLDVGCGTGLAVEMAAERGAEVAGLDAAENSLSIARERVPSGEFHVGDLEQLPFPDDGFDLVTGFNSFQFAGNPTAALAEARRVAKPGTRVAVMTWARLDEMEAALLVSSLRHLLPPPPPGSPGPFALSDEGVLRDLAWNAGLDPEEVFDVECPWKYPDLATALRGLGSTGVAARAIANSSEDAVHEAHAASLANVRQPDGSYRVRANFRCLFARA